MIIEFINCNEKIEILYLVLFCITILLIIISGFKVHSNEKDLSGKKIWVGIFSGVIIFFTDKYLNEEGKWWWPIYEFSILWLIVLVLIGKYFQVCN